MGPGGAAFSPSRQALQRVEEALDGRPLAVLSSDPRLLAQRPPLVAPIDHTSAALGLAPAPHANKLVSCHTSALAQVTLGGVSRASGRWVPPPAAD